jgi:hypothetical protein
MPTTEEPIAIDAYSAQQQAFVAQTLEAVGTIQQWLRVHRDYIDEAFLNLTEGLFELTVVGKSQVFDYALNKKLADLCVSMTRARLPVAGILLPASASKPLWEEWCELTEWGEGEQDREFYNGLHPSPHPGLIMPSASEHHAAYLDNPVTNLANS